MLRTLTKLSARGKGEKLSEALAFNVERGGPDVRDKGLRVAYVATETSFAARTFRKG